MQVIVYTGAVMMLFLFVLMLVGVDSSDSLVETMQGPAVRRGHRSGCAFVARLIIARLAARSTTSPPRA